MAPKIDLSKAAQQADLSLRKEKAGVSWLSDEDFTEYLGHWEALRSTHKQTKKHGGKRKGAGQPKKEKLDNDDDGDGGQAPLCTYWDVTAWCSRVGNDPRAFFEIIKPYFKSGGWQLEITTTGALHWQGRFATRERMRATSQKAVSMANDMGLAFMKPTAKCNMDDLNYQNKVDSRVAGPWSYKNPPLLKVSDVTYIEQNFHLYPYAQQLVDMMTSDVDPRDIIWVWDEHGKCAKSAILRYLEYHLGLEALPYCDNYKDFMQFAYGYVGKKAYAVNVSRGLAPTNDKERREFSSFIASLETLKDGWVFDTRNYPKKDLMHRPMVIVFANCKPIFENATLDRWMIMRILGNMTLEDCTQEVIDEWKKYRDMKREEHDCREAVRLYNAKRKYEAALEKSPSVAECHLLAQKRREDKEERSFQFRCVQTQHFERFGSTETLEGQAARYAALRAPHNVQKAKDVLTPLAGSSTDTAVAIKDTKLVFL